MSGLDRAIRIAEAWTEPFAWRLAYVERDNFVRLWQERLQRPAGASADEDVSRSAWEHAIDQIDELETLVGDHAPDLLEKVPLLVRNEEHANHAELARKAKVLIALLKQRRVDVPADDQKSLSIPESPKPSWDAELSELFFSGELIRKYRPNAIAACTILSNFQDDGWPRRIDNPLHPDADLGEAVRTLNTNLPRIKFRRDGSGEGIVWETL